MKTPLRLAFVLALFSTLVLSIRLRAEPSADSPEAVAELAMKAMVELRTSDFASMMHPQALFDFKRLMLSVADRADKNGASVQFLPLFRGVRTIDELRSLSEVEFMHRFMQGMLGIDPKIKQALSSMKCQFIGHVNEGDDVAHVVYRATVSIQDFSQTKVEVISLRRQGDSWGLMLTSDIEGMMKNLERAFTGPG